MIYEPSTLAIIMFFGFVVLVLGLSFYFSAKTKSASGYFAAGGNIHWAVNGIAFAGDYLSAASFLGICGMIAVEGYDGFLYSIGYLAGWIVALFLVAEPLKRLGKYTFADALDAKFNARSIQLSAAISTLVVSLFYLIPQMVGAGALVKPLLGFEHWVGVVIVGAIVIFIVATAGMTSTTYVQFIKGGLLIVFSTILAIYIFTYGLTLDPNHANAKFKKPDVLTETEFQAYSGQHIHNVPDPKDPNKVKLSLVKIDYNGVDRWFKADMLWDGDSTTVSYVEVQDITKNGAELLYNGKPKTDTAFFQIGYMSKIWFNDRYLEPGENTGFINPMKFLSTIGHEKSEIVRYLELKPKFKDDDGNEVRAFYPLKTPGKHMLMHGLKFKIGEGADFWSRLNFISLMLALFLGTASLPHILIRYYTVSSQRAARKSTIVAIAAIGFFYVLTLFMGLGAAVNGVLDVESSNMSGPLLAKGFGVFLFAAISAIAFATVLGTVAGLIVASSGAIAHDFMDRYLRKNLTDQAKVRAGKLAAFAVGLVAIALGILFKGMNVSFLVGWAFAVAASANLPAILMVLFWRKTTAKGVAWSIVVGAISALAIIITGPTIGEQFFSIAKENSIQPLDNPAIISFTLAMLTLVFVSLSTQKDNHDKQFDL